MREIPFIFTHNFNFLELPKSFLNTVNVPKHRNNSYLLLDGTEYMQSYAA